MKGMARLKGNLPAHTDTWLHRGFALCALFLLVFFFAFLGDAAPAPRKVTSVPSGGKVVSLEEWEDLCLLAYSGDAPGSGAVAALERHTGETQAQYALESGSLLWAAVRGGSLFLLSQEGETALLTQLSLPNLLKWPPGLCRPRRAALRCPAATAKAGSSMSKTAPCGWKPPKAPLKSWRPTSFPV